MWFLSAKYQFRYAFVVFAVVISSVFASVAATPTVTPWFSNELDVSTAPYGTSYRCRKITYISNGMQKDECFRRMSSGWLSASGGWLPDGEVVPRQLYVPSGLQLFAAGTGVIIVQCLTTPDQCSLYYYASFTDVLQSQLVVSTPNATLHEIRSDSQQFTVVAASLVSQGTSWMMAYAQDGVVFRINLNERRAEATSVRLSITDSFMPDIASNATGTLLYVHGQAWKTRQTIYGLYDLSTCLLSSATPCRQRNIGDDLYRTINLFGASATSEPSFDDADNLSFLYQATIGPTITSPRMTRLAVLQPGTAVLSEFTRQLLILGDSYAAGEGARNYDAQTDTASNHCHVSLASYASLLSTHARNIACTGAITSDVYNAYGASQYETYAGGAVGSRELQVATPGTLNQLAVARYIRPDNITLSIGGNDIGFSDLLKQCVASKIPPLGLISTCFATYEDRVELAEEIRDLIPQLASVYNAFATNVGTAALYAISYPHIINPTGPCATNVRLNDDERLLATQLIDYLNAAIKAAADATHTRYVDISQSLKGHMLCDDTYQVAVNGLTAGDDIGIGRLRLIGNESYHPNAYGYQLMAQAINNQTDNFRLKPSWGSGWRDIGEAPFLQAPKTGRPIRKRRPDRTIMPDISYKKVFYQLRVQSQKWHIKPHSLVTVELHSQPQTIGSCLTDAVGNLATDCAYMLPPEMSGGYHEIHLYAEDTDGAQLDITKLVYIVDSTAPDYFATTTPTLRLTVGDLRGYRPP